MTSRSYCNDTESHADQWGDSMDSYKLPSDLQYRTTESQNDRISWAGKNPQESLSPTRGPTQDHMAESIVWMVLGKDRVHRIEKMSIYWEFVSKICMTRESLKLERTLKVNSNHPPNATKYTTKPSLQAVYPHLLNLTPGMRRKKTLSQDSCI